ncbi:MAG TPA: hypothetical protein VER33_17520 [Polyangiaceae bacterium]|nr:hypothetical protein [Polyangiaceae bacterium]
MPPSLLGVYVVVALAVVPCAVEAAGEEATVWYRASAECPSGTEFIGKLGARADHARLAQAGDHIDFIVTLAAATNETVGRLERQTQGGTVAIRELRDENCSRVAEALALSLALALNTAPPAPEAPLDTGSPLQPEASRGVTAVRESAVVGPLQRSVSEPPMNAEQGPARTTSPSGKVALEQRWLLGLQGGALTGVAPGLLPRAALFVESGWPVAQHAAFFSLRLAAVGALGSAATSVGPVRRWMAAGRADACPWRWGHSAVQLDPCLLVELGATGAAGTRSTGRADASVWAALGAALRGSVQVAPALRVEAEMGAMLPLRTNDVYAGEVALYRAERLALSAAAGVSFGL